MAFVEDFDVFINADTPGYALASILGIDVGCLFDNDFMTADIIGTSNPFILCKQSDLDELQDFHDNDIDIDISINGIDYVMVGTPQYDGSGMARLELKRVNGTY